MLDLLRKFLRQQKMQSKTKKQFSLIIRLVFTTVLLFFLLRSFNWSTLLTTITHLDLGVLLLGMVAGVCGIILSCYQWKSLLYNEDIDIGLPKLINFYFIGIAFNHFLPTSVGGDVIKAVYVSRESGKSASSTSTVLLSRLTGMFGMFIVSLIALGIEHASLSNQIVIPFLLLVLGACAAIVVAVVSVSLLPKILRGGWAQKPIFSSIIKIGNALTVSAKRPRSMIYATLFGVLFHVETCLNYYIYAIALHLPVPFLFYLVAIPFVTLITLLPISINGFGVRESVFTFVFSTIHVPTPTALVLTFLVDLQTLLFGVIGGVIYLVMGNKKPASTATPQEDFALAEEETARMPVPMSPALAQARLALPQASLTISQANLIIPPRLALSQANMAISQASPAMAVDHALYDGEVSKREVSMNKRRQFLSGPQLPVGDAFTAAQGQRQQEHMVPSTPPPYQQPYQEAFQQPQQAYQEAYQQPQQPYQQAYQDAYQQSYQQPYQERTSGPFPVQVTPESMMALQRGPFIDQAPMSMMSVSRQSQSQAASRKPKKGALAIGAVFAIIIVLATGGYVTWKQLKGPSVVLYQVGSKQSVDVSAGGGGITYPLQQLDISYPVSERVVNVDVKVGDHVTPNQALIGLDPTQLNAQITQAANDVASAQAYLNTVQNTGNAVTIAQAQQNYQNAQNRYNALVAQSSSTTLKNGNLISPMNGVVTAVNVNPNEVFAANTVLVTIMDQSSVIVHAKIPLSELGQVSVGSAAIVNPSAAPSVNLQGTVTSVVPVADPQTDTFEALVQVKNPQQVLLPGTSAFVNIHGKAQGYALPRAAVLNADQTNATVFVVRNQHAYMQTVHVVGRTTDQVVVDNGVATGDPLVTVGVDQLQNGELVDVTGIQQ